MDPSPKRVISQPPMKRRQKASGVTGIEDEFGMFCFWTVGEEPAISPAADGQTEPSSDRGVVF